MYVVSVADCLWGGLSPRADFLWEVVSRADYLRGTMSHSQFDNVWLEFVYMRTRNFMYYFTLTTSLEIMYLKYFTLTNALQLMLLTKFSNTILLKVLYLNYLIWTKSLNHLNYRVLKKNPWRLYVWLFSQKKH